MNKNTGVQVKAPSKTCEDKNCPFHGDLKVHGRVFEGNVRTNVFQKTVTLEWERRKYVPKYERYEKRRTKIKAHVPPCIELKSGDVAKVMETRPLSKTKHFVVIEKQE